MKDSLMPLTTEASSICWHSQTLWAVPHVHHESLIVITIGEEENKENEDRNLLTLGVNVMTESSHFQTLIPKDMRTTNH